MFAPDRYSYYGPAVYKFAGLGRLKDHGAGFSRKIVTMGQDTDV